MTVVRLFDANGNTIEVENDELLPITQSAIIIAGSDGYYARFATIKPASTPAVPTDQALVVSISPNNSISISGTVTSNQGTSPWIDDITDRAGRLLGIIYGSQGQQIKQTSTNYNTQVEIAVGSTLIDPRSIRALTNSDVVSAQQNGTWTVQPGNTANTTPWLATISQGGNSVTVTASNALKVDGSAVTQPISGTITATQGTSPWVTNITQFGGNNIVTGTGASGSGIPRVTISSDSNILTTQSGVWTVQPGNTANTTPWLVVVDGYVTSSAPTYTNNTSNYLSLDTSGNLRVNVTAGTLTANQGTSPWVTNITQFGGTNISTGTGASGSGIPRVTVSNDSNILSTQSGTWTVQPGNTANTTPWLATINQGGNSATVTASNALKVDGSAVTQPVSGTVTANAGTGNFTVVQSTASNLNATAVQGTAASLSGKWPVQVTDGTNVMPTMDAVGRAGFHKITDGSNTTSVRSTGGLAVAPDPLTTTIQNAATITSSGNSTILNIVGSRDVDLIWNIKNAPTGTTPTIQFSIVDIDPVDQATAVGNTIYSPIINAINAGAITLSSNSSCVKISWTVTGTTPSFTGVNLSVVQKTQDLKGSNIVTGTITTASSFGFIGYQTISNTSTAANTSISVATNGASSVSVQVNGTYSGTFAFEGSVDNTNWFSLNGVYPGTIGYAYGATVPGFIRINLGDVQYFRIRALSGTTFTTNATVTMCFGYQPSMITPVDNFPVQHGTIVTRANKAATTGSSTMLSSNSARLAAIFTNESPYTMFLKEGTGASTASFDYAVAPFATLVLDQVPWNGSFTAIWLSATGYCHVTDLSP